MIVLNTLLLASECFFGGSLLLALAFLLSQGKPASQRHLFLTGAFAAMLLLPLASLALPSHLVWTLAAPQTAMVQTAMPVAAPAAASVFDWANIVLALAVLWAMGVIFVVSKAAFGGVALADLYRASVPHIPEGLSAEKFRGLNWQLRLRTTPGDAGPITWGIFRPVVLLPKSSVTWSRARLEAVLLHEAAHVRRKDCLSRLIAVIACALYWPNPLVWVAARIMRRDGETAADDAVLNGGIKASAYAEHLVGLARAFAASRPSYAGVSLAMAEPAMLDARVEAILNPTRSRKAIRKSDVIKIAILGLSATAVMALARPSLAEAKPEPEAKQTAERAEPRPLHKTTAPRMIAAAAIPEASLDADAPPEPPSVVVPPEPPAPPAAAVPPEPPAPPPHVTMRWEKPGEVKEMRWERPEFTPQDRAEIARAAAIAKVELKRAAILEKQNARAAMHVQVNAADILREHAADFAQAQAEIAKAQSEIAKAQATVHAALAKANISHIVANALDKAFNEARRNAKVDITVNVEGDDE